VTHTGQRSGRAIDERSLPQQAKHNPFRIRKDNTMNKVACFIPLVFCIAACDPSGSNPSNQAVPTVTFEPAYPVLVDTDVIFAEGLAHDESSIEPFAIPLKLDVYYPDANITNRPVFMFIHGGGFTGGTKTKPEIVEMAHYYASRGWVFASIDYRTTEELCDSEKMPLCRTKLMGMAEDGPEELIAFYRGIAPQEWLEFILEQGPTSIKTLQQGIAQYTAQRDAKSALRWLVANASAYDINSGYITVGGASAGAVTTIALGISNLDDFRDEISADDDPTLSTTNLDATYDVKSMVYFWGSNAKMDLFEAVYDLDQYDRYDSNDPELFMGHGEGKDRVTPYEGAIELQEIYDSLGLYSELQTLLLPDGSPAGHGAWNAVVDGKGLYELSFDFLVERQRLQLN
jgi:acetyl esterase/lipase